MMSEGIGWFGFDVWVSLYKPGMNAFSKELRNFGESVLKLVRRPWINGTYKWVRRLKICIAELQPISLIINVFVVNESFMVSINEEVDSREEGMEGPSSKKEKERIESNGDKNERAEAFWNTRSVGVYESRQRDTIEFT